MNQEHAFCLAVEKLLDISIPRRAQLIRVLYCETLAEKTCAPCRGGIPPLTRDEAQRLQAQAPVCTENSNSDMQGPRGARVT
jgi:hypothetical protein